MCYVFYQNGCDTVNHNPDSFLKMNFQWFFPFVVLTFTWKIINGLECYVCENQESNNEKCTKTIKTCEYGENVCSKEVKWGSKPYWELGDLKQYFVSKRCSTEERCAALRAKNMPHCIYTWYDDWRCSDCCKGDRCNYYYISTATQQRTAFHIMIAAMATVWLMGPIV